MASLQDQWFSLESPRELLKTGVGTLFSERYRCLRTNAEHDFITFRFPGWVNIIAETPEHRILMIRQFRHGTRQVEWEIPGGCMDPKDVDPVAAGIRELREETGFTGQNARLLGKVSPNPALQGNECYTIRIDHAVRTEPLELDSTEVIETYLKTKAEIRAMVRSGEIRHGLVLDAFYFALLETLD